MPKPQCPIYGELEARCVDARKELLAAIEVLEQTHPDDKPNNQSNVNAYKEQCATQEHERVAHVADCEECQKEN